MDPSLAPYVAMAAGINYQLIARFKKQKNRQLFVTKRLARLSKLVAGTAFVASAQLPMKENGFPDFSRFVHPDNGTIFIGKYTGSRTGDYKKANKKRRAPKPAGYIWHHHEVVGIMQLVQDNMHTRYHLGGVFYWEMAYNRNYGN